MTLDEDSVGVSSKTPNESGKEITQCPFMGGFYFTSFSQPFGVCPGPRRPIATARIHTSSTPEITVESDVPPSPRMMSLLEGLNEPGDSGNPPEAPPWFDKQLFDKGREFYKRYLFCLSFSDLLSLVLMLSADRALRPLIYTGQSDTPSKALKRYFSTLLHIVTWYTGDIWDPEDEAHRDIMTIRSVHEKVARLCNTSDENAKITVVQVSNKGHEEPASPFYPSIRQDIGQCLEAKLILSNPDSPRHYISQWDMCMTQYSFMGLLLAHPEKMGAGAATEEEFEGLIHFWRGVGWLLGIEDKYNFCSGSLAETRALCLEVERLFALPSLAEVDWNYEHMATSLMSGIHMIIPSISFPTMFRFLAHTIGIAVPSFVKRMSFYHCFNYWVMRLTFGLMAVFPSLTITLSSLFSRNITKLQSHRSKNVKCPLRKNYS